MNRRRFLTSATAFLASPALVRASSLDYVPRPFNPWMRQGRNLILLPGTYTQPLTAPAGKWRNFVFDDVTFDLSGHTGYGVTINMESFPNCWFRGDAQSVGGGVGQGAVCLKGTPSREAVEWWPLSSDGLNKGPSV